MKAGQRRPLSVISEGFTTHTGPYPQTVVLYCREVVCIAPYICLRTTFPWLNFANCSWMCRLKTYAVD